MHNNPDSWEGWYWGAMHHWGNSMRLGVPEFYGTVEWSVRSIFTGYLGWFDGDAARLSPASPRKRNSDTFLPRC